MYKVIKDSLVCPSCKGDLKWNIIDESDKRIINASIACTACDGAYEVKDEIGMFLTPDLQRNDLWERSASALETYFNDNPHMLKKLEDEVDNLNGADLWFLAGYYEGLEKFDLSMPLFERAFPMVYEKAYLDGWNAQMDYVANISVPQDDFVVDIASGKGYLVKRLLEKGKAVVATDFSPTILERNKRYYKLLGLYDNLSLLAFDAKRTPFKDGSVNYMTSNMGLQNIEGSDDVACEMTRILKGECYFVSMFCQKSDEVHVKLLKEYKMDKMNIKNSFLDTFKSAGLSVEAFEERLVDAKPTPVGVILEGGRVDGIPVEDTKLTFATMVGRKDK